VYLVQILQKRNFCSSSRENIEKEKITKKLINSLVWTEGTLFLAGLLDAIIQNHACICFDRAAEMLKPMMLVFTFRV